MKIIVEVSTTLTGSNHSLTQGSISNWDDIIGNISFTSCPFTLTYDNFIYTGTIAKTFNSLALQIAFDNQYITLPPGMCIEVVCPDVEPAIDETLCFDNNISPLAPDTRLAVLDDNGCPIGYVTFGQLSQEIINGLNIPTTLCELLGVSEIPQGNLIASDRILTTSGGCTLKSVPSSDVVCS